jgi:uncharacterized protein YndB with AHSA1/START domain
MTDDRIERETLIDAPIERVWPLVSEPGFWVAEEATIMGRHAVEGESLLAKNPHLGEVWVRVEKVDAPTFVAYRWASAFPGEELRDDNSTLVEFTLVDEAGQTRVRVVESGFASLDAPEGVRDQSVRFNGDGWPQVFDMLNARLAQRAS